MQTSTRNAEWVVIDRYAERFEAALTGTEKPDLNDFLPLETDGSYPAVLRELVRIELEHGWQLGTPRPLQEYLKSYPEIRRDRSLLQAVAFEEYRQRLEHADRPNAEEYQRLYSVDVSDWPAASEPAKKPLSLAQAVQAYEYFREPIAGAEDEAAFRTQEVQLDVGNLFRELHEADRKAAERLATAALNMPQVGDRFLNFILIEELGRGACGRVFLAHQTDLANRPVALKISADLHNEPETLARLQHTNIMPIYSMHRDGLFQAVCMPYFGSMTLVNLLETIRTSEQIPDSGRCIVSTLNTRRHSTHESVSPVQWPSHSAPSMEAAPQVSLQPIEMGMTQEMLDRLAKASYVEAVLWIGARLADGLAHAHERGVIHRDLKPANILLTEEGRPMLLDFNLADDVKRRSGPEEARIGGTLPYMAPEHLAAFRGEAKTVDARSDLYSLGLILYQLLSGHHPYPSPPGSIRKVLPEMIEIRKQPCTSLRDLNKEVTPAVQSIIRHCLEPDPAKRYQSARELGEDLERQLNHLPLKYARETCTRERIAKWARRHPRLSSSTTVATAFLLLFLALGIAGLSFWNDRVREAQAAERKHAHLNAQESLRQLERSRYLQQALMYSQDPDRADLERIVELSGTASNDYPILENPKWDEADRVRSLTDAEQEQLRSALSGTLFTWAEAVLLLAERMPTDPDRSARATEAMRLNQGAEDVLPRNHVGPELFRQRARIVRLGAHPEESKQWQERAEETPRSQARDYFLEASRAIRRHEYRPAMPLLQQATTLDPKHFWAWHLLGVCQYSLDDYPEAINSFNTCLALTPDASLTYFPYFHRGLAHHRQGREELAESDLDRAIAQLEHLPIGLARKERGRSYLERAAIRKQRKNYVGAEEDLNEVIARGTFEIQARMNRALVRTLRNNARGATEDREAALGKQPTDEAGWNDRALARMALDPAGALADLDEALKIDPNYYLALQNKASILSEQLNKPQEALEILHRLVKLYPGFTTARMGRGVLLARMGRRKEAHADAIQSLLRDRRAATYYQAANIYALTSRQEPKDAERVWPLMATGLLDGFGLDVIDRDSDMDLVRKANEFRKTLDSIRSIDGELRATRPE